jgi:DNA topoisomerase IA
MVVFGGIYEITKELNDLHIFDFTKKKWITLFEESNSPVRGRDGSPTFSNFDDTAHFQTSPAHPLKASILMQSPPHKVSSIAKYHSSQSKASPLKTSALKQSISKAAGLSIQIGGPAQGSSRNAAKGGLNTSVTA